MLQHNLPYYIQSLLLLLLLLLLLYSSYLFMQASTTSSPSDSDFIGFFSFLFLFLFPHLFLHLRLFLSFKSHPLHRDPLTVLLTTSPSMFHNTNLLPIHRCSIPITWTDRQSCLKELQPDDVRLMLFVDRNPVYITYLYVDQPLMA